MTTDIESTQSAIVDEFRQFTDWEDRYGHIIRLGRDHGDIDESLKVEKFRVKGCQSTVYLVPQFKDGVVHFEAASDAMIVNGLIAILMKVYSGRTPQEIVETPPAFIAELGLTENLTMGRQNGLKAMIEQIKLYGMAFQAMNKTGQDS